MQQKQLIPYKLKAYKYLKIEVWTKVAPFLKSLTYYIGYVTHKGYVYI